MAQEVAMKAVICPLCEGRACLSSGGGTNDMPCHGCDSRGWVEVSEDPIPYVTPYIAPNWESSTVTDAKNYKIISWT